LRVAGVITLTAIGIAFVAYLLLMLARRLTRGRKQ